MVAATVGIQVRGWKPYASTFAAFLSRAYDFVRMAAISRANLKLVGSHAGVSIGEDGPSQMALEDLAAFRAVHGSTVLYPSDANQTAKLVEAMADLDGIVFMRTTRANTPVIYEAGEDFPVGGAKVVRSSESDDVAPIGGGITLHEALKAADALAEAGVGARVIDLTGQAGRRRSPAPPPRRRAAGSWSRRITGPKAGWRWLSCLRSAIRANVPGSFTSPCASCPGRALRPSCSRQPGSMPSTSLQPRASSSRAPSAQRPDQAALTQVHPHPGGEEEFHPPPAASVSAESARA
jgi:hypothetical protein